MELKEYIGLMKELSQLVNKYGKEDLLSIMELLGDKNHPEPVKEQKPKPSKGNYGTPQGPRTYKPCTDEQYAEIKALVDKGRSIPRAFRKVMREDISNSFYYGWHKYMKQQKTLSKQKPWKRQEVKGEPLENGVIIPREEPQDSEDF